MASTENTPVVIGIYGVSGCGKSTLLAQLKSRLGHEEYLFFEGSDVIDSLTPGGLDAFKEMSADEQTRVRSAAIRSIRLQCTFQTKVGIVTGHFLFWNTGTSRQTEVWTEMDQKTYTSIIYLAIDPELVVQRRDNDSARTREPMIQNHIRHWQTHEITRLFKIQQDSQLGLFVATENFTVDRLARHVRAFVPDHVNQARADAALDDIVRPRQHLLTKALVFDGDRTLAPDDSTRLYLKDLPESLQVDSRLPGSIFGGPLGYTLRAFQTAIDICYEQEPRDQFLERCQRLAKQIRLYPEIRSLLETAKSQPSVVSVVMTCGLPHFWQAVLAMAGLSNVVVIGGGRLDDGYVVTPQVKQALVGRLRTEYGLKVWAFGDSPVDIPMLKEADRAIVVVGGESTRSKTMDVELEAAIHSGLKTSQVLVGGTSVTPRLPDLLPILEFDDRFLVDLLVGAQSNTETSSSVQGHPRCLDTTDRLAARLLATPTRDANLAGPALRKAHNRIGFYLANELVTKAVGVEAHPVVHVQGNITEGYMLADEEKTLIVAIMRGGEPMALGVSDAFPRAAFHHAKNPEDIKEPHWRNKRTIILVDSVINSGKTIVDFVSHLRVEQPRVRIVVVTGVLQDRAVASGETGTAREATQPHIEDNHIEDAMAPHRMAPQDGALRRLLETDPRVWIVALRTSKNKFTGTKGTDTGNRLFNTVELD